MVKSVLLLGTLLATCGHDVSSQDPPAGGETVFFSIDVLPLFQADCIHCHGGAGGLDLESFQGVMAGGNSGAVVVPGVPQGSLLIHRLEGTTPPTMPLDGPPLPQPEVDRIAQWILEGALDN